jgi:hypothetical protein
MGQAAKWLAERTEFELFGRAPHEIWTCCGAQSPGPRPARATVRAIQKCGVRRENALVNLYVGITDYDWFRFLSALPGVDEVNFWQPGGRTNFQALRPGELFLFKLHAPRNFIVGGGVFARADILPTSLAWEAFGVSNGAPSLAEMRRRIAFYRGMPDHPRQDYSIGCRVLTQPFFFDEGQWIPIPPSWSRHIQQGRTYDAGYLSAASKVAPSAERVPRNACGISFSRWKSRRRINAMSVLTRLKVLVSCIKRAVRTRGTAHLPSCSAANSAYRKQSTTWSLTIPVACIKA